MYKNSLVEARRRIDGLQDQLDQIHEGLFDKIEEGIYEVLFDSELSDIKQTLARTKLNIEEMPNPTEGTGSRDQYVGEFRDGKPHGEGTLYLSDGRVFEGKWAGFKATGVLRDGSSKKTARVARDNTKWKFEEKEIELSDDAIDRRDCLKTEILENEHNWGPGSVVKISNRDSLK